MLGFHLFQLYLQFGKGRSCIRVFQPAKCHYFVPVKSQKICAWLGKRYLVCHLHRLRFPRRDFNLTFTLHNIFYWFDWSVEQADSHFKLAQASHLTRNFLQIRKCRKLGQRFPVRTNFRPISWNILECFHVTSRRPYWCSKTMKRRPCWCPKLILFSYVNAFFCTNKFT